MPRTVAPAYDPSDVLAPIVVRSAAATAAAEADPFRIGPLGKVYLYLVGGGDL